MAYETDIQLSSQIKALKIDLGTAYETAEVFINEQAAGVKLCKPYVFDLSKFIKEGTNKIRIEVTNTLGTKVRGGLDHYLPIEPFGVEGPIKMLIGK